MTHEDKRAIANPLNNHYKTLADWLHTITSYVMSANCSHHGRLWNRELAIGVLDVNPRNFRKAIF
jgi:abortive infection bacteriophage resistance protein